MSRAVLQATHYQNSPVGTIPTTWGVKSLGELSAPQENAIVDGPFGSNLKVSDYVETGVPVLQGSNITGDRFRLQGERFVSPAKARVLDRSLVRVGDLLVVKIGSVGYSAIIDDLGPYDKALIPANLLKATFDDAQVTTRYVHYYLTSETGRTRLIDMASQTAQPALTLGRFKGLMIPVPTLPEQRRIAEILDTAGDAVREAERVIAKLRQVKTGLLQDLLTRGLDAEGRPRDPEAHPEQFKDSPLGRIPGEWEVAKLRDISAKITDRDHTTPIYVDQGILMVSPINFFGEEGINFAACRKITLSAHQLNSRKTDIIPSDIIMHRIGAGLGQVRLVTDHMPEFSILHSLAMIRPDRSRILPKYLLWAFRSDAAQHQIGLGIQSIGVPDLGLEKIGNLHFPMPILEEQERLINTLDSIAVRIRAEEADQAKLRQLKRGLMEDLLTGRVRVT